MSNNFHRNHIKENDIIKEIISKYDDILNNKNIINEDLNLVKLNSTNYPNLKFDSDGTQNDSVNKPLLDDINAAAKSVGIVATITTAKTGHNRNVKGSKNVSRHMNGTGVDVAILDGVGSGGASNATNGLAKFRELGFKLKDALVSMGYTWNTESGKDKAVLWHTNIGGNHYNHLHISNRLQNSSSPPSVDDFKDNSGIPTTTNTDTTTNDTTTNDTTTNDVSGDTKNNNSLFSLFGGKELMGWLDMFSPGKKSGNEKLTIKNSQNIKDTKLPSGVLSSIEKLKKSPYNLNITQDNIDKEFKMEGNPSPDNGGVNKEAEKKVKELIKDCKLDYPNVKYPSDIVSGYRSYDDQVLNFGTKAKTRGVDDTQKSNSLPGFSQHHTGKAFDIFSVENSWWDANKDVKEWVSKNASKYGFEVTYVNTGKLRIPEPWHLYYIGGSSNSTSNISENKKTHKINEEVNRMKDLMKKNL
jgi:LAS superfamily LD-carboxypeptidase LdcB